ncbi:DUF2637 domain-containing protein [Actinoplanes sp. CA-054009]
MILEHLRRVRWAVRATLLLGVAASVVANVLHALDNPISQAIAAWPPLALLLTVELISRVPVHRKLLAAARFIATALIAGIAAWVSYWHMVGVAARYGETGASPYLLPLSVDGLIVVASICLVELGGRISTLERAATISPTAAGAPAAGAPAAAAPAAAAPAAAAPAAAAPAAAAPAAAAPAAAAPAAAASSLTPSSPAALANAASTTPQHEAPPTPLPDISDMRGLPEPEFAPALPGLVPTPASQPSVRAPGTGSRATTAAALAEVAAALPRATDNAPFTPAVTRQGRPAGNAPRPATGAPRQAAAPATEPSRTSRQATEAPRPVGAGRAVPAQRTRPDTTTVSTERATRPRRTPAETVALAHEIKAARPDLTESELATELGISPSRWRTIRREAGDQTLAA